MSTDRSSPLGLAGCCPPLTGPALTAAEAARLSAIFKALADPVRLRLLSLIASRRGGEICVCELTGFFEVTGPTISHHLKVLRQAGLIGAERRGTWVYYWVVTEMLDRIGALFPHAAGTPAAARTQATGTPAAGSRHAATAPGDAAPAHTCQAAPGCRR